MIKVSPSLRPYLTHRAVAHHLQIKISREHSPTRKKSAEKTLIKGERLLNLCVSTPINLLGPTNPWAHHLPAQRPLATWHHLGLCMDSRGPATRPRYISATQAPAWARVALPRGLVCHVASPRVPRDKITPFCPFKRN